VHEDDRTTIGGASLNVANIQDTGIDLLHRAEGAEGRFGPRPDRGQNRVERLAGTHLVRGGIRRQQVRDCGKRHGARLGTGGRPPASATRPLGHLEALLGQTRLPDPGRTVDDESVTPWFPKGAGELGQLGSPPDQRPALSDGRRAHVSVLAVVAPPGTRSGHSP
jgi:hypothetical protein